MARKFTDALDHPITQPPKIIVPSTGSIDGIREASIGPTSEIEPITDLQGYSDKAAQLAFMEEPMSILIHESTDQNPEYFVFLSVNGKGPMPGNTKWVPRGVQIDIARKYIEILCRAKPETIRTVEGVDNTGGKTMNIVRSAVVGR